MFLKVKDNGIGMNQEQVEKIKKLFTKSKENDIPEQKGFGLFNVNERIKLNFGAEYGIDVKSEYGVGSEFTICVPKITENRHYNK